MFDHYIHFFKTIIETLSPHHYKIIASRKKRYVIAYFYSLIFFSLFLSLLIAAPAYTQSASRVDEALSKFSVLNLTVKMETTSPILIPSGNPYITIDTEGKVNRTSEFVFADADGFAVHSFFATKNYKWSSFGDLLEKREFLKDILSVGFLASLPVLLFVLFIGYSIKYTMVWAVSILLGYFLAKLMRLHVKFTRVIRVTGFASTWIILPELLIMPYFFQKYLFPLSIFGFRIYVLPYLFFWIYTITAFYLISEYRHDKYSR
ncbi:MAG TPA: DUF1189 family protein [Candidatus Nanoarchaeia archaeon]|nr:DUF1189 family protein [Candidatus Nanoarchaeia archaeon]